MSGSSRLDPAVLRGFIEARGFWKTICIRGRRNCIAEGASPAMDCPSKSTSPEVGATRLRMIRPMRDLPLPETPARPNVSPSRTAKLTSSTTLSGVLVRPDDVLDEIANLDERSGGGHAARLDACSQQRATCPAPTGTTGGASRQDSIACGQRGRKLHPAGRRMTSGTSPAICRSRSAA